MLFYIVPIGPLSPELGLSPLGPLGVQAPALDALVTPGACKPLSAASEAKQQSRDKPR